MKELLFIVLLPILLSSGSVFASAYFNSKYEEALPITASGIVLILFLFGLVKLLNVGVYIVLLGNIVLLGLGIFKAIKDKKTKKFIKNIFTPGFILFAIFLLSIFISIKGLLLTTTDEFSHWGDIVKVMCYLNDFGTNPNSYSLFKSYPPGMALFQYYIEKLHLLLFRGEFAEWLCYLGYDILIVAYLLPCLSKIKNNKVVKAIAYGVIILFVPYLFYSAAFTSLYIDCFVGILAAAGLLELLCYKENDSLSNIRLCSILFMLPMAKDSGLLFAVIIAVSTLLLQFKANRKINLNKILIVCSTLIGKLLWTINLKVNDVTSNFNGSYDLVSLINVLLKREVSYRSDVLKNFIESFLMQYVKIGDSEVAVNYFTLFLFIVVLIIAINTFFNKKNDTYNLKHTNITAIIVMIIYIVGICLTYMYKFSEEEALELASFERYIRVVYLASFLLINIEVLVIFDDKKYNLLVSSILILFSIGSVQIENVYSYISGMYRNGSIGVRQEGFGEIVDESSAYLSGGDKVWYINEDESSDEHLVYRFVVRPNIVDGTYSIGTNDDYLLNISPIEWINELIDDGYDYVAIHHYNDEFVESYQSLFKGEIKDNSLYKVNSNTKMLEICE